MNFRSGQYLTFRVGRHELAIWAADVRGVLPAHEISVSGDGAAAVTTNGETLPVIDLRAKLNLRGGVIGRNPSILVIENGAGLAAFFVDGVSDVIHARARDFRVGKIRIGRPRRIVDVSVLREDPVHSL